MGVRTVAQRDERIGLGHTACKLSGKDLFPGWFGFGQTWEELVGVWGMLFIYIGQSRGHSGSREKKARISVQGSKPRSQWLVGSGQDFCVGGWACGGGLWNGVGSSPPFSLPANGFQEKSPARGDFLLLRDQSLAEIEPLTG